MVQEEDLLFVVVFMNRVTLMFVDCPSVFEPSITHRSKFVVKEGERLPSAPSFFQSFSLPPTFFSLTSSPLLFSLLLSCLQIHKRDVPSQVNNILNLCQIE